MKRGIYNWKNNKCNFMSGAAARTLMEIKKEIRSI